MKHQPTLDFVSALLAKKYPLAQTALVAERARATSVGETTPHRELELVVIFETLEASYSEGFVIDGYAIEAHCHDPATLRYFICETSRTQGRAELARLIVQGQVLGKDAQLANELKSFSDRILDSGPPRWTESIVNEKRFSLTQQLRSLTHCKEDSEFFASLVDLYNSLSEFYFRAQARWTTSGRDIPQRLQILDSALAEKWHEAFQLASTRNIQRLETLLFEILRPYGDPLDRAIHLQDPGSQKEFTEAKKAFKFLETPDLNLVAHESSWTIENLGLVKIESATQDHVPQLTILLNRAYKRLADMGLNFSATFQNEARTSEGFCHLSKCFIVLYKDKVIGTMKLKKKNEIDEKRALYLSRFAVDPDFQKYGLGSRLLDLAESVARREGFDCLQLDTAQPAHHLVAFYQSKGFKIAKSIYYEGKTYLSWILMKELK